MKPTFFLSVAFFSGAMLLPAGRASAETFVLVNGGQIEGTLVTSPDAPRDKYVIKTTLGGEVTLLKDQVKEVIRRKPAEVDYEKIRHQYPDTVEGQWSLAEWCREKQLLDARKVHLKRVIELDPNHEKARGALGYGKFDGQWKTQQELMTERGFVEYKGRWRTPQEVQIVDEQRAAELGEKTWFNNLKRWRDWLGGDRDSEARRSILAIRDPLAIPALKKAMETEEEESIRQLLAEALAGTGSSSALQVLADRSLEDESEEVRLTCLDFLSKSQSGDAVTVYIRRLHDPDNVIVRRAAVGLAKMKDPAAIVPLVNALVTTHQFKITTGAPQGSYTTSFGNGGSGFSTGGGGPKIIKQEMQNPEVLDALTVLTSSMSTSGYGYDMEAWKRWLATQRKSKFIDARRG